MQEMRVRSLGWEDPLEKEWQPTPVFLPGKFHIQRSLEGYSPKACQESDTTERRIQQHNTVFHHSTELQTLSLLPSFFFFLKPFFFLNCVFSEHQDWWCPSSRPVSCTCIKEAEVFLSFALSAFWAGRFRQIKDKVDMFSVLADELSTLSLDVDSSVRNGHVVNQGVLPIIEWLAMKADWAWTGFSTF